jgi:hypothetical protein
LVIISTDGGWTNGRFWIFGFGRRDLLKILGIEFDIYQTLDCFLKIKMIGARIFMNRQEVRKREKTI